MSEIISPYYNFELADTISLAPNQLNNNLYINLKENIKKKRENKCTKYGYVKFIHKITEYNHGVMEPENFTGNIKYSIKYVSRLCRPNDNDLIICKVDSINQVFIKSSNGPIINIITLNKINDKYFRLNNKKEIIFKNNEKLKVNDFIVVSITAKKINYNDSRITSIGILERIPTSDEINKYYNEDNNNEIDPDSDDLVLDLKNEMQSTDS